ncbi:tumor necrosis factor receptor superfamily member 19L isoform X1 [Lepisosteus oculatus]|uniref:tumor necrosis factor receptor superfamily member 19L isoform X1 n=1 Tax=Lepisosteus oculatus TaxID=7918 RepID=UPI00371CA057
MMRNHLRCSTLFFLTMLSWRGSLSLQCGKGEVLSSQGLCVPCLTCPQGQEPDRACGFEDALGSTCRACPGGTFSDRLDAEPCRPHTQCHTLNRSLLRHGTAETDTVCGECLPGFYSSQMDPSGLSPCLSCKLAPIGTSACEGLPNPSPRLPRSAGSSAAKTPGKRSANSTSTLTAEEKTTEYAVFALVPIFCVMGLLGILICNILKKKGYHCVPEKEGGDEEAPVPEKDGNVCPYTVDDANEDTISVLVRLITEKKENAAALEELLKEYESKQMSISKATSIKFPPVAQLPQLPQLRPLPRLCPHQHHLHTVQGLAPCSGTCCSRCSQKKWPEILMPIDTSKTTKVGTKNSRPGEITILSVGRFQVAQIPELKPTALAELTPLESSDTDSIDTTHTEPADEKSLLGSSSSTRPKTKWLKPGDSKPEDRKLVIRLGETNLVI